MVVIANMLILTSNSLPFPASRIAKAIGAAIAGVTILYIATLVAPVGLDPLLLPNFLLYGATVALAAGYIAELRFPRVYYYISLGVIAVVGAFAIVTGGVLLQELPPLTAFRTFADAVFTVSAYLSATSLTALGVLAIIYLAESFLQRRCNSEAKASRGVSRGDRFRHQGAVKHCHIQGAECSALDETVLVSVGVHRSLYS